MRNRRALLVSRTLVTGVACSLLALVLGSSQAAAEPEPPGRVPAAAPVSGSSVVVDWMRTASATIQAEKILPPEALILNAYVSTAVYNAVVGIEGHYTLYKWQERGPQGASSAAAAASAAHHLLRHYFPSAAPQLDAARADTLAAIPDGWAEDAGVAFGENAAAHIIDLRRDDGRGAPVPYTTPPAPGTWRPTPPANEPFATAWAAKVRPMLLDSPQQFRPEPPPTLTSARYTKDFDEVKTYGAKSSSLRTPEQTDTARFFASLDLQQALGDHALRHGMDITRTARLYAAANTSQADAVITAWDAKLHYATWRLITAIRLADTDNNPATHPDQQWEPLLTTPAHPDYLSGHATMGGALMQALTKLFNTPCVDLNIHSTSTGAYRHYQHADEYNRDVINARVWAGIHTRTADTVGNTTGRRVAAWALERYFQPIPPIPGGYVQERGP
ncbi:hypothetical protein OV450_8442 [Actinobacteria bacterium OV450]|nr:hypothetical protein OV450_8442 [Actinobacteria bacterium OV450]